MPRGKLYDKMRQRRKYKKKVQMTLNNKRDALIAPSTSTLNVIPNKLTRTLRYSQKFAINSNAGLAGSQVFRANSCFDPDFSGLGHQPRGFDQYMTMFDHYQVIGSKITIASVQPNIGCIVGVALKDSNTPATAYSDYLEERGPNSVYGILAASGEHIGLDLKFSQKSFFGSGKLDDKYQGSATTNPTETASYQVWQTPINDTSTLVCYYVVTIDYICVFTEPKQPIES